MKTGSIKIGAKSKSTREQLNLTYRRPENLAECLSLCDSEDAATARFVRGLTIYLQDAIGRPMFEAGEPAAAIQEALDTAVVGKTKRVPRPAKPKVVNVPSNIGEMTREEKVAYFAKQGIAVTFE